MVGIDVRSLRKVFGNEQNEIIAVDDLDLQIENGEFLILVGPSGCGKTTTLRCIAGLEGATDGHIYFDEDDVTDLDAKDRNIAMVFQSYALYPHMTARENMSFSLKYSTDLEGDEIERRVDEAAELLSIPNQLNKKPGELSGGQQQRVALGRSIVREPGVFLMDEPLSNLDAKLRAQMRTELQELHDTLGITTIYVTHDQEEAMTMGDRIAIMNGGELQQIGTPLECYHEPANQFVAGFIGSPSMNFFDVTFAEGQLENAAFTYSLSSALSNQVATESQHLTLGIRPEDITPLNKPDENTIKVQANVIEPMGDLTHIYVEIGGSPCTITVSGDVSIEKGDEFYVEFPEDRIHLFDGESGDAIKNRDRETTQQSIGTVQTG